PVVPVPRLQGHLPVDGDAQAVAVGADLEVAPLADRAHRNPRLSHAVDAAGRPGRVGIVDVDLVGVRLSDLPAPGTADKDAAVCLFVDPDLRLQGVVGEI